MIVPWQITEKTRNRVIAQFSSFEALVLVYQGQKIASPLESRFSEARRQETIYRLQTEMNSQRHIWIASGRHTELYALLHAEVITSEYADVDLLCSARWGYNHRSGLYEGFGEFTLLITLLSQRSIKSCRIPLDLDVRYSGPLGTEWRKQAPETYIWKISSLV